MEQAISKVEWTTIFFFIGLFVLVSGLVETGVIADLAARAIDLTGGDPVASSMLIMWLSAIASAFVDNIPFVATMIPMIQEMGSMGVSNLEPLWWSLALGACLGGNGTLIGASANLITAGLAAKEGHPIRFLQYLKYGLPMMLISVVISSIYIYVRYLA
jgi:Na+/H+ antiporter NhaD/arsenite permease-like protein